MRLTSYLHELEGLATAQTLCTPVVGLFDAALHRLEFERFVGVLGEVS